MSRKREEDIRDTGDLQPGKPWRKSIRLKTVLLVLLMVTPLVLMGIAGTLYYQGVIRQNIDNNILSQVKTISALTPEYMNTSQLYLQSIADRPLVIKALEDNDRTFLHSMAVYANETNRLNSVYFADSKGTIIESSPEISGSIGSDAINHSYVSDVIRTGDPVIGDAEPGFDQLPVVPVGVPILNGNDTVIGVMVGSVDLGEFARMVKGTNVNNQQYIYLVNKTGHIMVHDNPEYFMTMADFNTVPGVQHVLQGETGVGEYVNPVENQTRLSAYAPVEPMGWGVIAALPVDVAYQPVRDATWLAAGLIVLFSLVATGLGVYFGNSITAPITSMSQATRVAFKDEDYSKLLPLCRDDEIGDLARSFSGMVDTIKREERERGRVVKALQESEERFRALADNIPNLAWMANADGWIFWYNKQWYDYTGTTPEEMQGWGWQKVHHPDYVKAVTEGWSSRLKAGQRYDDIFPLRGKDGNYRWFLTRVTPIRDEHGNIGRWFGTNTDITELRQAEEARERLLARLRAKTDELENANEELEVRGEELAAQKEELECANEELRSNNEELQRLSRSLHETQDYLENLINYANAPIIVWDPNFTITRFNRAFERLSGYTASEVLGKRLSMLFPEESCEESLDKIKKTLEGEQWESVEIPILHKFGSVRIALWNSANIYDDNKCLLATIAQGQDITRRKQTEQELEEAKAQAELYLDLMGHDISNMHQIIMMQLELASEIMKLEGKLEGEDKELIHSSARTLEKAAGLINNVRKLQMLRSGEYKLETVDLAAILKDALKDYAEIPGRDIAIRYIPGSGDLVLANSLLKDVFGNLLDNAVKHSSGPLEIGIEVNKVSLNGSVFYRVTIEDNGNGIPDEKKEEVFQRFKRGQTKAKGTGLGLYLVRSLVEGFGGHIEVHNKVPGDYTKGTRFLVYLPEIEEGKNAAGRSRSP